MDSVPGSPRLAVALHKFTLEFRDIRVTSALVFPALRKFSLELLGLLER